MIKQTKQFRLYAVVLTLLAVILDLFTPLGLSAWLLYVASLFLLFLSGDTKAFRLYPYLVTAIIVASHFVNPRSEGAAWGLADRGFAVLTVWALFAAGRRSDSRKRIDGLLGDVRDMEEKLREREERLRSILENSIDAAYRRDLRTGTYDYMSPVIERLTGYPADEFSRFDMATVTELIHPDDRSVVARGLDGVMSFGGATALVEYRFRTSDGRYVWLADNLRVVKDEGGVPRYRVGIVRDITERKIMEDALRDSETRYRSLYENNFDAVLLTQPDGEILAANPQACRMFRMTEEELTAAGREGLVVRDETLAAALAERERDGKTHAELKFRRRDGRIFIGEMSSIMLPDGDGAGRMGMIIRDVTERRQAEDVLRRDRETLESLVNERTFQLMKAHAELERSRRLADIGRLASTIAHEIRNPLSGISAAAYNIRRKAANPLVEKHVETIRRKIGESNDIIQNLLSFTRVRQADFAVLDIAELLRDCAATVRSRHPSRAGVEVRLDCPARAEVEADVTQMRMLFCNIIDNAFQATAGGEGMVCVSLGLDGGKVFRVEIADTGTGMDEEAAEKVFEPFFTTRSKGTGLGLAVCREIVEMHGGEIRFESEKGKGTVFFIALPVRQKGGPAPGSVVVC